MCPSSGWAEVVHPRFLDNLRYYTGTLLNPQQLHQHLLSRMDVPSQGVIHRACHLIRQCAHQLQHYDKPLIELLRHGGSPHDCVAISNDLLGACVDLEAGPLPAPQISMVNAVMAVSKTFFLQPEEEKKPFSRKSFANPNHGWVNAVMAVSKTFFLQPEEEKKPFSRKSFADNPNHGWVEMETERLNPARPGDLKEAFNKWPSGAVEGFQEIQTTFFRRCKELSLRVLRLMALSLGLDPQVFLGAHRFIGGTYTSRTVGASEHAFQAACYLFL
ncbi:hypothetical protein EYF80_048029 [Liparis tanakae]|uniref:Uncharacterized protein n=1 Tax=Liparis tanakae TaxID=230148 RepID=A0A4Z2FLW9_9TELE|nr:hypothetical protein EYF80_048029 [Liparis tanakae]